MAAIILVIPMAATYCAYTIYCHGRFGQTVGKYAMSIRVVRTTGEPIRYKSGHFGAYFCFKHDGGKRIIASSDFCLLVFNANFAYQ